MNDKTKEFREHVSNEFVKALEEKNLNWKKEWNRESMNPCNATTGISYKGINFFYLSFIAMKNKYTDNRWCTFNQIKENKWKLKKGAKAAKIEYWFPIDKINQKIIPWNEYYEIMKSNDDTKKEKITFRSKYYSVFNGNCIENIPPIESIKENEINQNILIDKLSNNMNIKILNDGGDSAFYNIKEDKIHLPKKELFVSDYVYNSTALHELAHSTSAPSRLNRKIIGDINSNEYAIEELIVEISSCFMSNNLSIEKDEHYLDNHKAYVSNWISAIKEKPDTLIKAIKEASKVANYMEYKAELINEKDYNSTCTSSIVIKDNEQPKSKHKER